MVKDMNAYMREYRKKQKEKAKNGDKKALEQIERKRARDRSAAKQLSRCKTFINKHATKSDLLELQKLIEKNLKKLLTF